MTCPQCVRRHETARGKLVCSRSRTLRTCTRRCNRSETTSRGRAGPLEKAKRTSVCRSTHRGMPAGLPHRNSRLPTVALLRSATYAHAHTHGARKGAVIRFERPNTRQHPRASLVGQPCTAIVHGGHTRSVSHALPEACLDVERCVVLRSVQAPVLNCGRARWRVEASRSPLENVVHIILCTLASWTAGSATDLAHVHAHVGHVHGTDRGLPVRVAVVGGKARVVLDRTSRIVEEATAFFVQRVGRVDVVSAPGVGRVDVVIAVQRAARLDDVSAGVLASTADGDGHDRENQHL